MVKNGEKWWKMVNIFYGESGPRTCKFHHFSPFFTIATPPLWLVEEIDLVRRQECQMAKMMEIIHCFKTEALADKEKLNRLQGKLLVHAFHIS